MNLDAIANATRKARFRFDVGVFDKSRLVFALDYDVRGGESIFHVSANHAPAHQNILFAVRMNSRGIRRQRFINRLERRQRFPLHRELGQIESFQRVCVAHYGSNRFPAKACFAVSKHWLVRISGNDAIAVDAGHVLRG